MAADKQTVMEMVKQRLGITSTVRDTYLLAIADSVIDELKTEKGLSLNLDSPSQFMFVVDYATWRYESKDSDSGMPRHLRYRLNNLIIHVNAEGGVV